ncbi:Ileal sodium/bile acid cotransporter [Seminavis robusta]|uniref:Ileal sodium/bile acid cotransporter n=1 Tax=Seminavis robusta TaxID=568900 RepID=A0A9N8DDE2_9STRA|nr:Ileal sodium/bile acid cotransporter [Seminavis robusta]|eukprot:Sro91_g047530.1 Ileal sodium/bile acid cotransporter (401) ;mRNA; r:5024-6226
MSLISSRLGYRHLQTVEDEGSSSAVELVLAVGIFLLMVGVGSSCKWTLFRKMLTSPQALKAAAVGVMCQFLLMPVVAYVLTKIFGIESYAAFGVVVAGAMPGGNSSNIYTIWGHGILELSVFMTIVSTVVSFGMTPLWIFIFGTYGIDFDDEYNETTETPLAIDQIAITLAMLIIPLAIGISLNFCTCTNRIRYILEKGIHVLAILFFLAVIVVLLVEYSDSLTQYVTWQIGVAAFIYFPIATGLSYGMTTLLKFPPAARRTVVMEVGIQNLALGFAIGEQVMKYKWQKERSIPFPLLYAIFMYAFATLLVPVFRRQKRVNEEKGIVDHDPNLFLASENNGDEKDDVVIAAELDADDNNKPGSEAASSYNAKGGTTDTETEKDEVLTEEAEDRKQEDVEA